MSAQQELNLDKMRQLAVSELTADFASIGAPMVNQEGQISTMPKDAFALSFREGLTAELLSAIDFDDRQLRLSRENKYNGKVDFNDWLIFHILHPQGERTIPDEMLRLFKWETGEDGRPCVKIMNPYTVYKINYYGSPAEGAGDQSVDARHGMSFDPATNEISITGFDDYDLVGCAPVAVNGNYGAPIEFESDQNKLKMLVDSLQVGEIIEALGCEHHPQIESIKQDIDMCLFICKKTMPTFYSSGESLRQKAYIVIRDALKQKGYELNAPAQFVDMVEKPPKKSPFLLLRYHRNTSLGDETLLALVRITQEKVSYTSYFYSLEVTQFSPNSNPEPLATYAIPKPR